MSEFLMNPEVEEEKYSIGKEVNVKRSNGDMESGWKCIGKDFESGKIRLSKIEDEKELIKYVNKSDLDEIN